MPTHADQLKHIVTTTPWLMALLRAVRDAGPREAYVAAGAIRDTVWNSLTQRPSSGPWADVDVVYCDPNEPAQHAAQHEQRLSMRVPGVRWEVTNQAWVHLWQPAPDGSTYRAHRSVEEGLATWPESATAVGVRIDAAEQLWLVAPCGLEDLFGLVVRHNRARASAAVYRERVIEKQWARRWPELSILAPL
jgi:hypothetical protein